MKNMTTPNDADRDFGSSDCSSALEVLQRLREWTINERDAFAEQAKGLDRDKMHFEADQKWQKYWAFNTVCLWADEEIRKIYAKMHPAEAATFTEHVQRQHGIVRR